MALADQAELAVRLSLDDRFSGQLGRAASSLGKFQSGVSRAGKGVGQLAGGLLRVGAIATGAITAGLTGAAKAYIDFEDAFAGVVKTVDEGALAAAGMTFDDLRKTFRDMATEIPVAATDLAKIGEAAGALGIRAQDIDDFTRTVALLGVTTDLSTDAAAEALGKVGTILGLTGKQYEQFADTLVNLGNQGASFESEIVEVTKRFAAQGKQVGLTTNQILALASAATSLGAEPEAAGSALSRIFSNMTTDIAEASEAGMTFAKLTGDSLKQLQMRVDKGEALPILLETLKGISGMSRTKAASVLKALGIVNVRDRDAILKMAQNLGFVNDQLEIAENSVGSLGEEAGKRFATIASKITLLKQNLIEAAMTLGEGFAPAVGRAAEKLTAFLKLDSTKRDLKKLGEDIGKFIDDINWTEVVDGAKSLVGVLKEAGTIAAGVVSKLPKEVLALGTVAIGANQLSGGLLGSGIGNIVGGLGETVARSLLARVPLFGPAFVQPVFVTNMGLGGMGGGAGVPGGGGGASVIAKSLLPIAALVYGLNAIEQGRKDMAGVPVNQRPTGQFGPRSASNVQLPIGNHTTRDLGNRIEVGNNVTRNLFTETVKQTAILGESRSEAFMHTRALEQVARESAANVAKTAAIGAAISAMPPPQVSVTVPVSVRTSISVRESQQVQRGFTMYRPPTTVNHL